MAIYKINMRYERLHLLYALVKLWKCNVVVLISRLSKYLKSNCLIIKKIITVRSVRWCRTWRRCCGTVSVQWPPCCRRSCTSTQPSTPHTSPWVPSCLVLVPYTLRHIVLYFYSPQLNSVNHLHLKNRLKILLCLPSYPPTTPHCRFLKYLLQVSYTFRHDAFLAHLSTKCSVSFCDPSMSVVRVCVRACVNNFFKQHLRWNRLLDFYQTSQEWSLGGPLSKLFRLFQLVA